jgi:acetylglutamate kinase
MRSLCFDGEAAQIVEMVLVGRVNKSIVTLIEQCDGKAVGLCGKDAGLVKAEIRDFDALGYVGDVTSVDVTILQVGLCSPCRVPNPVTAL